MSKPMDKTMDLSKMMQIKNKIHNWLERIMPPGASLRPVGETFFWGLAAASVYSWIFLARLANERDKLFYTDMFGDEHLIENAVMPDFVYLIQGCLLLFYILAAVMLVFIVFNYMYYRRGTKSIYTMRRLPNKWEIHKRSIILPVLAALAVLAAAFVTLMIHYGWYMLITPDECLVSGQLAKLWRGML